VEARKATPERAGKYACEEKNQSEKRIEEANESGVQLRRGTTGVPQRGNSKRRLPLSGGKRDWRRTVLEKMGERPSRKKDRRESERGI